MVSGDRVQISPAGRGWRPPPYITNPTTNPSRNNSRPAPPPHPSQASLLPAPTTTPAPRPSPLVRLFRSPRIVALLVSFIVFSSVLTGLCVIFSGALDHVADVVEEDIHLRAKQSARRTVKQVSPHAIPVNGSQGVVPHGFRAVFKMGADIQRIISMLVDEGLGITFAAAVGQKKPISGKEARELSERLAKLHNDFMGMYHTLVMNNIQGPVQAHQRKPDDTHQVIDVGRKAQQTIHATNKKVQGKGSGQQDKLAGVGVGGNNHPHTRKIESNSRGHKNQSTNKHVDVAAEIGRGAVADIFEENSGKPLGQVSENPINAKHRADLNKKIPTVQQGLFPTGIVYGKRPQISESVEIWELPGGKSLCRLFNAGYLPDGTLVLQKWMAKHDRFLRSQCGIEKAFYVIEPQNENQLIEIKKNALNKEGISDFQIDTSHSERDLFGISMPRNHMPHFVSDIFFHLVACEAFLGSGRNFLRGTTFVPQSTSGSNTQLAHQFQSFKPTLLLQEELWKRPSGDWVLELAQFFRHPSVGFTFIPTAGRKTIKSLMRGKKTVIKAFHSVVMSNLNAHEPYGLFGANGTNVVLRMNGINKEPAWRMEGMRKTPCVVNVVVLTRKGPRALLHLNELRKEIEDLGKKVQLKTNIRVVDFSEVPFKEQVAIMQNTNVLIATHGAGNSNLIFMRPSAAVIEVFPFAYKAGPFDRFASIFGLQYQVAMSAPQTAVFKDCMNEHENKESIKKMVFSLWDKAVAEHKMHPWVHRLELEKEFGAPGKSEGMTTRGCVRLQELEFNIKTVAKSVIESGSLQCAASFKERQRYGSSTV